jgi:hypothetical protein
MSPVCSSHLDFVRGIPGRRYRTGGQLKLHRLEFPSRAMWRALYIVDIFSWCFLERFSNSALLGIRRQQG